MGYRFLVEEASLAVGSMKKFDLDGSPVLLIHLDEGFFATHAKCPHMKLPLEKGELQENCRIQCKFHRATFDIKSGEVVEWANFPPGIQALNVIRGPRPLPTYPVKVEDGRVYVDLDGSGI